jgi:hypothetical protein
MIHLTKFTEYIKESNGKELDLDLIENEYLVPIKQLGVKINIHKKMLTRGDFAGNNEISINFDFSHFVRVNGDGNSDGNTNDKRIWELMDELIMFKNVIEYYFTNNISIWLGPTTIDISMYTKLEENDEYFIKKLLVELKRSYSRKIQIISSDNSIKAYIYGTKRLWDNFIRSNEVDLSKFDTEVIPLDDKNKNNRYWQAKTLINITHKKQ